MRMPQGRICFYGKIWFSVDLKNIGKNQGNLKGESVVAAILPSCMEASYCTSGFFRS